MNKKVKLLILTQKVDINDPVLGFFHGWIKEFAKHCEKITVIALGVGEYDLPNNVRVLSLGKERDASRLGYVFNFYRLIWNERKNYDTVFVHMNPVYVILGGLLWRVWGKKIYLWYTHKNVDLKLRIAERLTDKIFTASPESFRLVSKKVMVVGHGIDVLKFSPVVHADSYVYTVISVGRFSPTKKQHDMVMAFKILSERGFKGRLILIGGAITEVDIAYEKKVKEYIRVNKLESCILCVGPVSPDSASFWYKKADMLINLSETGSMDKAVLEGMASGLQILTSNEAFKNILPADNLIGDDRNEIDDIVWKVTFLSERKVDPKMREYVVKNHNLTVLLQKLAAIIKQQ